MVRGDGRRSGALKRGFGIDDSGSIAREELGGGI